MASNVPSVPSDLAKLTVPQLKVLCKERRITGYSKLSKVALLRRLVEVAAPTGLGPITPSLEVRNPAYTEPSTTYRNGATTTHPPVQPSTAGNTTSTGTSATKAPKTVKSLQAEPVSSTTSSQKTSGTKRPAHIDTSATPKRIKYTSSATSSAGSSHEARVPGTSVLQQTSPADSSVFKIPELPVHRKTSFHITASSLARPLSTTSKGSVVPRQTTSGHGRFKPLGVISRPQPVDPVQASKDPARVAIVSVTPRTVDSSLVSNFRPTHPPVLSHITFPPKASERKWVYRWAIILSALSPGDRQTCMLVSRTLRYAVYLSATHILSRNYSGRRLDGVLERHPRNMTNFWPYLRYRAAEISERRCAFKQSFLGRYTDSMGYDPLSEVLWASPDDEKQVDVALRFVLTRMWFAISVGAYGHDASKWPKCVIRDVREVVKGEVWHVLAQPDRSGKSCGFYVLEATCEVIGRPPSSQAVDTLGYCLRADWTTWVFQQSRGSSDAGPCSLLECVKWSNTEDYVRGISKAWLCRVQGQDSDNIAKRNVAEKYILASVMANSISGKWMTTSAMAQEFAGLPSNASQALGSRAVGRLGGTVNMYLPAHHHVESVHFATSKGEVLHSAVAVVQTPGREYYVLRDNGMQVGCEEEGIPEVWQQILGCDTLGRAH